MASDTQTTGLNGPETSSRHGEQSHTVFHELTVDGAGVVVCVLSSLNILWSLVEWGSLHQRPPM